MKNNLTDAHDYGRDLRKRNEDALRLSPPIKIKTTSIKLPQDLLDYYDLKVVQGEFLTRSEAIRYYLRYHKDLEEKKGS